MRTKFIFVVLLLFLNSLSCSLISKRFQETPENTPQWRAAGGIVPAEIAEEIQKISGETPQYIGGKTPPKGQGEQSQEGALTSQNQWSEIASKKSEAPSEETSEDGLVGAEFINKRKLASPGAKTETYKVKKGDTLMKIAFEKYGNLYRWKEIFEANRGTISGFNHLIPGMSLTIEGVEYVVIEKNGSPYLIKKGDTLSKISHGVYGDSHFWRELWFNNKQLIHDPNQIFYGFTLYYRPLDSLKKGQDRGPAETR